MPHQCTNCAQTFADGSKEMLSGCPNCGGNKFQFRPSGTVDEDEFAGIEAGPPEADKPEEGGFADAAARAGAAVRDKLSGEDDRGTETPTEETGSSDLDVARSGPSGSADPSASRGPSRGPSTSEELTDPDAAATNHVDGAEKESATAGEENPEDSAQVQARSDMVSSEELSGEVRGAAESWSDDASSDVEPSPNASPSPNVEPSPDAEPPPDADGTVIEPSSEDRPDLDDLREELNEQFESIKVVNPGQYELNLMELYDREEYIISLKEDGRYVIEVPDTWHDD